MKQLTKGYNLQNIQAVHTAQYQKNKQPNQKMVRTPKQTFLQRRHTDGQQTRCSTLLIIQFSSVQFSLSVMSDSLQPNCLENPRDGEAWWASIYGVAQSRTWLKWLSSSSRSRLQNARPPCPSPTPGVDSNSCPLSRWCHSTISSSISLMLGKILQSFPALGSFLISKFFISGGQIIGVSASTSVLPMNIQDWFPLGWTGWISLQTKGLSRVFSNTTVQKYQFYSTQLSVYSNFHIHTWLLEKPQLWLDRPLLAK